MEPISAVLAIAKLTGLDKKIGGWIAGDNGAKVASTVLDAAAQVTGGKTPEQALQLLRDDKAKAHELKLAIIQRADTLDQLAFSDKQSARDLQKAALENDDVFSKRFLYYFSIFWSLFTTFYITAITFLNIPESSVRFADSVLGFLLGTIVAGMFQFFYGSSAGNERRYRVRDLIDFKKGFEHG